VPPGLRAPAPAFSLPAIGPPHEVSLAGLRGGPVVLVFGSLTCDVFCGHLPEIERLYRSYGDRAAFLFVCIREAGHRIDGLEFLLEDQGPRRAPLPERRRRVARGVEKVGLSLPGVIDLDGAAEAAYHAFPLRLVVVDAEGKVELDLGVGVFTPWDLRGLEGWLKAQPRRDVPDLSLR
jgi:hypothetical protein